MRRQREPEHLHNHLQLQKQELKHQHKHKQVQEPKPLHKQERGRNHLLKPEQNLLLKQRREQEHRLELPRLHSYWLQLNK